MSSCCAKGSGKRRSTIVDAPDTLPDADLDEMECVFAPASKLPRRIQASLDATMQPRAASLAAAVRALPASKLPMVENNLKKQAPGANALVTAVQRAMDVGKVGATANSGYWKVLGKSTLPHLADGDYWVVDGESRIDAPYNCLAHVLGDTSRVHWPGESKLGDAFDEEDDGDDTFAQQEKEAAAMSALPVEQFDLYFARYGFEPVELDGTLDEDDLPDGMIMAYGEGPALMHFALKVPGGWESKTGPVNACLFHATLAQVACRDNGEPMRLYRPVK